MRVTYIIYARSSKKSQIKIKASEKIEIESFV